MLRRLIPLAAFSLSAHAAIWPEQLGEFKRAAVEPIALEDRAVWDEYGLEAAERARYESPSANFTASAWRMKDPTSALAVFQWKHPPEPKTATRLFHQMGNYILDFEGRVPTENEMKLFYIVFPRLDQSALPVLPSFLPTQGLLAGSQRYLIGPAGLDKFEPRVPPSTAAFSLGAEAQVARYRTASGEIGLAVFSYPTPHIARDRLAEFQKLPNAVAKRSGPLVAVAFQAPNPDEAERLLARVNYQATVTWNEKPLKPEPNMGDFLVTVFTFTGLLVGFTILAGLGFAGIRIGWRRWTGAGDEEPMVTLHLGDR